MCFIYLSILFFRFSVIGGDSFQIMNKIIQITLHGQEQPWNEAQAVCESTGGNLLRLDSEEKQHALTHYQTSDPTWQQHRYVHSIIGPRREKTCLRGFRQSELQTSLLSYTVYLENYNFTCSKFTYDSFQNANNKGADQTAPMRRLVCA